jgi:hypothetical protein
LSSPSDKTKGGWILQQVRLYLHVSAQSTTRFGKKDPATNVVWNGKMLDDLWPEYRTSRTQIDHEFTSRNYVWQWWEAWRVNPGETSSNPAEDTFFVPFFDPKQAESVHIYLRGLAVYVDCADENELPCTFIIPHNDKGDLSGPAGTLRSMPGLYDNSLVNGFIDTHPSSHRYFTHYIDTRTRMWDAEDAKTKIVDWGYKG